MREDVDVVINDEDGFEAGTIDALEVVDDDLKLVDGYALRARGRPEHINCGPDVMNDLSEFTITFWILVEEWYEDYGAAVRGELQVYIRFWSEAANHRGIWIGDGNNWVADTQDSTEPPLGEWIFVTFRWDGKTAELLYNDAEEQLSMTADFSSTGNNTNSLYLLGNPVVDLEYMKAYIDDVRVYDRALTDHQIGLLYSAGDYEGRYRRVESADLVAWWPMNDGSGSTVKDAVTWTSPDHDASHFGCQWFDYGYFEGGQWRSPEIDISSPGVYKDSTIFVTRDEPTATSIKTEIRVFDGTTWSAYHEVTVFPTTLDSTFFDEGDDLAGCKVQFRITLTTDDPEKTPTLEGIDVLVFGTEQIFFEDVFINQIQAGNDKIEKVFIGDKRIW